MEFQNLNIIGAKVWTQKDQFVPQVNPDGSPALDGDGKPIKKKSPLSPSEYKSYYKLILLASPPPNSSNKVGLESADMSCTELLYSKIKALADKGTAFPLTLKIKTNGYRNYDGKFEQIAEDIVA